MPDTTSDAQMQTFESVQKLNETTVKQSKPQQEKNTTIKTEPISETREQPAGEGAAAQLLRKHGITLLPADDGSTVLNAIQSGRTVVLSDAGKLMLKESDDLSSLSSVRSPLVPAPSPSPAAVLTPPRAGLKVFTLNNKLLLPTHTYSPNKKVKFVQLPSDNKLTSPVKTIPMKAKTKLGAGGTRPAVKIIMNKANFNKLLANATTTLVGHSADTPTVKSITTSEDSSVGAGGGAASAVDVCSVADVCSLSAEQLARCSAPALRVLLARALAELRDARHRAAHQH